MASAFPRFDWARASGDAQIATLVAVATRFQRGVAHRGAQASILLFQRVDAISIPQRAAGA
jgi:hypothetical protein